MLVGRGRPTFVESWTHLPVWKLHALEELDARQAETFNAEAERLDVELFGPHDG
jgi:hypothetical protein